MSEEGPATPEPTHQGDVRPGPASSAGPHPTPLDAAGTRSEHRPGAPRRLAHRFRGWREGVRGHPGHHRAYKLTVAVIGAAIVVAGVVLLPLPGPGWVIIFIGLAVLASEFTWARRLEQFARRTVRGWNDWLMARSLVVRVAVWAVTALFAAAVVYGALVVTGIPSWVPDRLVPALPGL